MAFSIEAYYNELKQKVRRTLPDSLLDKIGISKELVSQLLELKLQRRIDRDKRAVNDFIKYNWCDPFIDRFLNHFNQYTIQNIINDEKVFNELLIYSITNPNISISTCPFTTIQSRLKKMQKPYDVNRLVEDIIITHRNRKMQWEWHSHLTCPVNLDQVSRIMRSWVESYIERYG